MIALDTGICTPESERTLALQQRQLRQGKRPVQMFPAGTKEFDIPLGFDRHENSRGVFHFNPALISIGMIEALSRAGKENEFLNLGPFCKFDIAVRVRDGEQLRFITEYDPNGIEIRSAAATDKTLPLQMEYFRATMEPDGAIDVSGPPPRILQAIEAR